MNSHRTHIPAHGSWFNSWTEATRRLRPREAASKPAQGDPLLDARSFIVHGRQMLAAAREHENSLALVMFYAPDMEALTLCLGQDAGRRMRRVFAGKLFTVAGELGIVGELRVGEFALLLPLADEALAIRMVAAEFGTPPEVRTALRLQEGDEPQDISLLPHCLAVRVDAGSRSLEQGLQSLRERLQAKAERVIALADLPAPQPQPQPQPRPAPENAYAATVPAPLAPLASPKPKAKIELGEWKMPFDLLPATVPVPLGMR